MNTIHHHDSYLLLTQKDFYILWYGAYPYSVCASLKQDLKKAENVTGTISTSNFLLFSSLILFATRKYHGSNNISINTVPTVNLWGNNQTWNWKSMRKQTNLKLEIYEETNKLETGIIWVFMSKLWNSSDDEALLKPCGILPNPLLQPTTSGVDRSRMTF